MNVRQIVRLSCIVLILWPVAFPATAEDFTNAIQAFVRDHVNLDKGCVGMVVGIVDEHGSSVVSYGKIDDDSGQKVDGDTEFELGSITKTFTALLLEDMVERGELKLNDPAAKYLPTSVKMPTRGGKEITLLHLATHTSGLPRDQDNMAPLSWAQPFADYTVEQLYAFLSGCTLSRDPGSKYEYSNIGYGLLGHLIALKAASDYESLVVDRICRSLSMDSTRITLPPALKARSAIGHGWFGKPQEDMILHDTLKGGGGLHSTANDMLKFLSANLGFTQTHLRGAMEETHVVRLQDQAIGWGVSGDWISKGGMSLGCTADVAFDKKRRHGVVVLSNRGFDNDAQTIVAVLLDSEWQADKRPKSVKLDGRTYESYVGQYQFATNDIIGIRRDGDRLLVQETGQPGDELLPQSETRFFLRVSGKRVIFTRESSGRAGNLIFDADGTASKFVKTSDHPLKPRVPPKLPIFISIDAKAYVACSGKYRLPSGRNISIKREDDHLLAQYSGWFGFELSPTSETNFCSAVVPLKCEFAKSGGESAMSLRVSCPLFDNEFTGNATRISQ
jgi:CubicO group peptidase (beta-lactamase class C family)